MKSITIIDGRGYIFDVETSKFAREIYHIAGVLAGVLPQFPQQNIFGGLPLQLLPEEIRYLLETGEFALQDGRRAHEDHDIQSPESEIDNGHIIIRTNSEYSTNSTNRTELIKWIEPAPERYNIFKFLVNKGYFIMPGSRFGCQFMAYPGDLMRYHSHYNVLGFGWNEQFNILDIINGGRLATSVKKCWVVGARNPETKQEEVYSIEWAQFG